MIQYFKPQALILSLVTIFITSHTGISIAAPIGKVIWQNEEQFISLVPQDNSAASKNHHPAELSFDSIAEMLYSISISDKKSRFSFGGKKADLGSPLFSENEIVALSKGFVEAFSTASPEQDILFRVHGGKEQLGGITQRKTINTGRAFWRDNHLHIIFGEVHGGDKTKWLYGQKQKDTYERRFGSRTTISDRVKIVFAPVTGITQYTDSTGKIRPDWVVIDPNATLAQSEEEQQQPQPSPAQPESTQAVTKPQAKIESNQQTLTASSPAVRAEQERSFILKLRLTELKELRDEGLITEEIYQQKVKEVVDKSL